MKSCDCGQNLAGSCPCAENEDLGRKEVRHSVTFDNLRDVEFVRYQGTPAEQLVIEGSICPGEEVALCRVVEIWARDPVGFWDGKGGASADHS